MKIGWPRSFAVFRPILAGATLNDRLIGCAGALVAVLLTGLIGLLAHAEHSQIPFLVAPIGASAVLLFAVPASPLAQPWPIIGGNVVSAFVGTIVAHLVPDQFVAAGVAVGAAIAAMSLLRCLHPPGGAAALLTIFSSTPHGPADFIFPLVPVGLNTIVLVALGWIFHRTVSRHSYPHPAKQIADAPPRADESPLQRVGVRPEDIDQALEEIGEAFDISRGDIERLIGEVEARALIRKSPMLLCRDVMSRDVISIRSNGVPAAARSLLVHHDLRVLPVVDADNHLLGSVGYRELMRPATTVADVMTKAMTATPDSPALSLARPLSTGREHAVMIIDDERHLLGLITQTDLLAAMSSRLQVEGEAA